MPMGMVFTAMAQAIITEAGLGFLGVGLDPATPSWGTMLNDGRDYLLTAWWISTMPGIAIGHTRPHRITPGKRDLQPRGLGRFLGLGRGLGSA